MDTSCGRAAVAPLRQTLRAWATTAAVMRDPVRRAILTSPMDESDFVEVAPPVVADA